MSQNGQTHFINLAANVSDHFGTLCIKAFKILILFTNQDHLNCEKSCSEQKVTVTVASLNSGQIPSKILIKLAIFRKVASV